MNRTTDETLPLYETIVCQIVLITGAGIYFFAAIGTYLNMLPMTLGTKIDTIIYCLLETNGIFMIAIVALSVQFCWLRWRRRAEHIDWAIPAMDPRRFFWSWGAIAILACIAIPTISAFLFMFWLGPWYLYRF